MIAVSKTEESVRTQLVRYNEETSRRDGRVCGTADAVSEQGADLFDERVRRR